jgi:uncharacterized PurR-regulated membrane protein YhhQ (DUF165 family)
MGMIIWGAMIPPHPYLGEAFGSREAPRNIFFGVIFVILMFFSILVVFFINPRLSDYSFGSYQIPKILYILYYEW